MVIKEGSDNEMEFVIEFTLHAQMPNLYSFI